MITEEQYKKALQVIDAYNMQSDQARQKQEQTMALAQKERENNCLEHIFIERGKWTSGMMCQDCGKIID